MKDKRMVAQFGDFKVEPPKKSKTQDETPTPKLASPKK